MRPLISGKFHLVVRLALAVNKVATQLGKVGLSSLEKTSTDLAYQRRASQIEGLMKGQESIQDKLHVIGVKLEGVEVDSLIVKEKQVITLPSSRPICLKLRLYALLAFHYTLSTGILALMMARSSLASPLRSGRQSRRRPAWLQSHEAWPGCSLGVSLDSQLIWIINTWLALQCQSFLL